MKSLTVVAIAIVSLGLAACAPSGPTAERSAAPADTKKGTGRRGDWRGNANSFPWQR